MLSTPVFAQFSGYFQFGTSIDYAKSKITFPGLEQKTTWTVSAAKGWLLAPQLDLYAGLSYEKSDENGIKGTEKGARLGAKYLFTQGSQDSAVGSIVPYVGIGLLYAEGAEDGETETQFEASLPFVSAGLRYFWKRNVAVALNYAFYRGKAKLAISKSKLDYEGDELTLNYLYFY